MNMLLKICTATVSGWRMSCWLVISIILIAAIAYLAPSQIPVILNKLLLVSLAAFVSYRLSVSIFPYARPGELLYLLNHTETDGPPPNEWELMLGRIAIASMECRARLIGFAMVAVALGL
jgi:Putative 2/3 transmembrane domain holin